MAFKVLIFAATLAFAHAGNLLAPAPAAVAYSSAPAVSSSYFHQSSAPVAVAHSAPLAYGAPAVAHTAPIVAAHSAPVAIHQAPSYGYSEQNVARSLGGGQSVSTYSKAVDSAFSSVRKYDTRITNDGLSLAPASALYTKSYAAPVATTYTHAAPAVAYSQPLLTKSYAAPAQYAYSSPVVTKTYAAASPVAYSAPAQVYAKTYAAPAQFAYSSAPVVAKSYAAPAQFAYSAAPVVAKTYAAPAQFAYSAGPVVAKSYAAPAHLAYAQPAHFVAKQVQPVASYAASAPVLTKSAVSYSPATVVAHTNFEGYGIAYHY